MPDSSVLVVDYGAGNLASVANMVRKARGIPKISNSPDDVRTASRLILPGVGAFDHGVDQLQNLGLFSAIQESAARGVPILGICLGMQLLAGRSEEGRRTGLELIDAEFKRFEFAHDSRLRVPHVGWNHVKVVSEQPGVCMDGDDLRFYFTHSYYAVCRNDDDVIATAEYGRTFVCAYRRQNTIGVQFHPEKSHRFGMALIASFVGV